MSAGIQEHPGNEAGRVTILTTLNSLVAPFFVVAVAVGAFLLGIISAEIAAAVLLTAVGQGALTSGTVFTTAKNTKTDRADVVWGAAPVADVVHPLEAVTEPYFGEVEEPEINRSTETESEPEPDPFEEENKALLADVDKVRDQG